MALGANQEYKMKKSFFSALAALAVIIFGCLAACNSDPGFPAVIERIEITKMPDKIAYNTGETLNLAGMVVTAIYSDGTEKTVQGFTTNPTEGSLVKSVGFQNVKVLYTENGNTVTAGFNVVVPGLGISQFPKTSYLTGETFSITGLEVKLYLEDCTSEVLPVTAAHITGFDSSAPGGTKILTVNYEGKSANFTVWVYTGNGMIWIEAGAYIMGNPDASASPSACIAPYPQRKVILTQGFFMGKYEVTQGEYQAVTGNNPSRYNAGDTANFPVEQVSWYDAVEFCNMLSIQEGLTPAYSIDKENPDPNNTLVDPYDPKWTVTIIPGTNGYRLPTEAQWEYACRAGTTSVFNVGDTITTDDANYNGAPYLYGESDGVNRGQPLAVGSFAPNPWGLYDMHGNVWEWCWDFINDGGQSYYSDAPNPDTDPHGLDQGNRRVERGGSWNRPPARAISAYRERARPQRAINDLGFRVIRPQE